MDLGLKGKTALVLGASAGIGKSIAKSLASEGARVCIVSRSKERIEGAKQEVGAEIALVGDLSKEGEAKKIISDLNWDKVDILVINTGGPPKGGFEEINRKQWSESFENLWMSVVELTQGVLPQMRHSKWGRILLVTSVAAKEPMPGLTISNGFRSGLAGLMKSLSDEVASDGITVNLLLPGYTKTERLTELGVPLDSIAQKVPAKRLGRPDELADLAAFLSSERAGYITGQSIAVDGGYLRGI